MKKLASVLFYILALIILFGCSSDQSESAMDESQVITVLGPIHADSLGVALIHEHVFLDWSGVSNYNPKEWNNDDAYEFILPYLQELKELGIDAFMECTPAYIGRNPELLQRLSRNTGMHILTNTGLYAAREYRHIPDYAYNISADSLATNWIHEFENGIEDTEIKPGFIKIGLNFDKDTLSAIEEKIVRAAAITHNHTGLSIVAHSGMEDIAILCLEIMKSENILPEAFIWTHAQNDSKEAHVRIAQRGAWVSLDGMGDIGMNSASMDTLELHRYVDYLIHLKQSNLLHRVLISHDSGWYTAGDQNKYMGRPYTSIHKLLLPELKKNGFSETEIFQLMVTNPKLAYSLSVDRAQ